MLSQNDAKIILEALELITKTVTSRCAHEVIAPKNKAVKKPPITHVNRKGADRLKQLAIDAENVTPTEEEMKVARELQQEHRRINTAFIAKMMNVNYKRAAAIVKALGV